MPSKLSIKDRTSKLRLLFCPKTMVHQSSGKLNQAYFSQKPMGSEYSDIEKLCLFEGIEKHHMHSLPNWIQICKQHLPHRVNLPHKYVI